MRRLTFVFVFVLLSLAAIAQTNDSKKPAPGEEVKATELESAELGKYIAKKQSMGNALAALQSQANQFTSIKQSAEQNISRIVKEVTERYAKQGLKVVFDENVGEDGVFRVAPPDPPKSNAPEPTPAVPVKK
jgi:hypothetical protein